MLYSILNVVFFLFYRDGLYYTCIIDLIFIDVIIKLLFYEFLNKLFVFFFNKYVFCSGLHTEFCTPLICHTPSFAYWNTQMPVVQQQHTSHQLNIIFVYFSSLLTLSYDPPSLVHNSTTLLSSEKINTPISITLHQLHTQFSKHKKTTTTCNTKIAKNVNNMPLIDKG